jgi:type II secretory pathway pseudopilin PulG
LPRDRRNFAKRGFTLLEVVFCFLIASILLAMTAVSLRGSVSQEGSRGLAYALAEDLRATRAEAQGSGVMVAACFPNDGGANPFSSSFVALKGEQRGTLARSYSYKGEFKGAIFVGSWPGGELQTTPLPRAWRSSTTGHAALFFRPDGTVFSNEIPLVDGRYPLVVGSAFRSGGASSTGLPTINAVSYPYTVSISRAGTVRVEARSVPGAKLAAATELPPTADPIHEAPGTDGEPMIVSVSLLPDGTEGTEHTGVGRTYVQIHPLQRTGSRVEYGLATFKILAEDTDGGPLTYKLEASASQGSGGSFSQLGSSSDTTVSEGTMTYVDNGSGDGLWQTVISWRPPKGAPPTIVYDFELTVTDPDGNQAYLDSDADIFPSIATLTPPRVVMETSDGSLLMTNVDGTSMKDLTRGLAEEHDPFFSSDGTRLYCFSDSGGVVSVIMRNSDGTDRKVLRSFPYSEEFQEIKFDPFYTFAAYLTDSESTTVYSRKLSSKATGIPSTRVVGSGENKKRVTVNTNYTEYSLSGEIPVEVDGYRLMIMHLNSGEEIQAAEYASDFRWFGAPRYSLRFEALHPFEPTDTVPAPAQGHKNFGPLPDYVPFPGYAEVEGQYQVQGFPPRLVETSLPPISDSEDVFNPAVGDWYVQRDETGGASSIALYRASIPGFMEPLIASGIADGSVGWSPDGRSVIYAISSGGGTDTVYLRKVLSEDYNAAVLEAPKLLFAGADISSPQISADGKFAFFVRDGDLIRVGLNGDSPGAPVNLTNKIESRIEAFVVSR